MADVPGEAACEEGFGSLWPWIFLKNLFNCNGFFLGSVSLGGAELAFFCSRCFSLSLSTFISFSFCCCSICFWSSSTGCMCDCCDCCDTVVVSEAAPESDELRFLANCGLGVPCDLSDDLLLKGVAPGVADLHLSMSLGLGICV